MFALVKTVTVTDLVSQESSEQTVIKLFPPYSVWEDKDGIQYSPETLLSLSTSDKKDKGIYDVAYGVRKDDRFYYVTEDAPVFDAEQGIVKISFTSVPKDLEDGTRGEKSIGLKTQFIDQFKGIANSILSNTDWMLVRKIERNVDVPAATAAYREAVIAETTRLTTDIAAVTTVEELIAVVNSANWPVAE